MQIVRNLLNRFWSFALVFVLPAAELFAERFSWYPDFVIMRAILSAVCIALLVHSWFMQRKNAESGWRLTFWTLLLLFFVLEFLWLALNSVRGPNYPADFAADNRAYWFAVEWQDRIVFSAEVVAGLAGLWVVIEIISRLKRRRTDKQEKIGFAERNQDRKARSS